MEQKRCSFVVAKALKEAGYNEPCDMYYHIYDDEYESETSLEMTGNGCNDFYNSLNRYRCACPTYMDVWLWLWREKHIAVEADYSFAKDIWFDGGICGKDFNDPEETIIAAIEYLVENDLIK